MTKDADADRRSEAAPLIKEARDRAIANDFNGAADRYQAALDIWPNTAVLFSLAVAEQKAARNVAALAHFRRYLQASDADTQKRIVIQNEFMPKLVAATGRISLVNAPLAALYVDGVIVGYIDEDTAVVDPGSHELTSSSPVLHRKWHASVNVVAGGTVTPEFEETEIPAEPAPASAASDTSNDLSALPVQHASTAQSAPSSAKGASQDVDIGSKPIFWVVMGAEGVASMGVFGGGFAILYDGINNLSYSSRGHQSRMIIGGSVMGLGLISLVATPLVTMTVWSNAVNKPRVSLAPELGPTGGGLTVHGSF